MEIANPCGMEKVLGKHEVIAAQKSSKYVILILQSTLENLNDLSYKVALIIMPKHNFHICQYDLKSDCYMSDDARRKLFKHKVYLYGKPRGGSVT